MERFAALLDGLIFTPARNGKLTLMKEYFRDAPDPDRGWALAAMTGELSFREVKTRRYGRWRWTASTQSCSICPTISSATWRKPCR